MTEQPRHNRKGGSRLSAPEKKQTPDKQKKKEKIIMVVMIILSVIMVLAAVVAVLYTRWIQKPVLPSALVGTSSNPAASGGLDPDVTLSDMLEELAFDPVQPKVSGERKSEDFYTILVFGTDETSGLTDTIMVVSYDVTNQKATVMSIPRDTIVNVRNSYKSINGVYNNNGRGEKGITALKNEVSELVGFMPDYYVMINWELVGQMVDAIGGVWFDIPYHMDYDDVAQGLYIHFDPGYQYLNGEDAMRVVRWRKNNSISKYKNEGGGSDTSRLEVQHAFLKAVLQQTLQLKNVTKISQLAALFSENVVSDLSVENLFWFGSQAIFSGLSVDDVTFVTMPYLGGTGDYANQVYPYQSKLLTMINESLNPFVEDVTVKQLDLIRVNSDGTLSSSTGKLADPSAAIPKPSEEPIESEPIESDPLNSNPEESEPAETDDPGNAEPSESEWPIMPPEPGESEPPAAPSQEVPADIPPETSVPLD